MNKAAWRSLALATALAVLPLGATAAEAEPPGPLSADVVAAMTPQQQGEVLEPLRVVADAAARVGRGPHADVYTQVEMAADYRSVNVYLTDPNRGPAFLDAVRKANPQADTKLLNVRKSAKTLQQLRKEITGFRNRKDLPFKIEMAGSTVDGGAIELAVDDAQAARKYLAAPAVAQQLAAAGATPLRIRESAPSVPLSRWDDRAPFYAGAALGPAIGSFATCTSGIPAVSTVDNRPWLVTAGHCYGPGATVFTAGGFRVGQIEAEIPDLDSAFIAASTSRYTWDGLDAQGYTRRLNGVRNAAVGDFTCQLGYNSKVVCNIRTTYAGSGTWVTEGAYIWGSAGVPHNGGIVARPGDSGGPVITINDQDSRQLNGMVVNAWGCEGLGNDRVCRYEVGWIEVGDIFERFGLRLAD
ncbi:hypothetical protein [Streptomyces sp. 3211]|uniref:hypothetical protein n=1 Tax=Streptomyces sp. 3211 TaxID=1964449 RepID=UPI0009A5042B|nr:hypothetical protein [Streptomyces sp. 3211]